MKPQISVVVLTLNEADNIDGCLNALAAQDDQDFEVIVVDAASTDDTTRRVMDQQTVFPVPLRLEIATRRLAIGEARNLGARLANHSAVAYLSADAEPQPNWIRLAREHMRRHGMVFGRQLHTPRHWTIAACVRGLRYNFPLIPVDDPLPFASNVAGAFDKEILMEHPFVDDADAAEDLLLAKLAHEDGHTAIYDPHMIVRHHDVQRLGEELRKVRREGKAWGRHRKELGVLGDLLAWAGALVIAAPMVRFAPRLLGPMYAGILIAPAMRRAKRRRHAMPPDTIITGTLASPVFDLVFLMEYLRGLTQKPPAAVATPAHVAAPLAPPDQETTS